MNRYQQKGTQVNHTGRNAQAPSLRTGLFAIRRTWVALFGRCSSSATGAVAFANPSECRGDDGSGAGFLSERTALLNYIERASFAPGLARPSSPEISRQPSRVRERLGLLTLTIAALPAAPASAPLAAEFGTEGCGPGRLKEPSAVAVNEATGNVYVVDQFDSIGAAA